MDSVGQTKEKYENEMVGKRGMGGLRMRWRDGVKGCTEEKGAR